MQKISNIFIAFLTIILIVSCSPYQKVLNRGKVNERYKMGTELYKEGKYAKALTLLEKVIPLYTGKPQLERVKYMVADSHFKIKDYTLAGYYFRQFANTYQKSSKREEALFLSAKSYYYAAPKYNLDQTDTHKAIEVLQDFINTYPNSAKLKEANQIYKVLSERLEKKYFEISKQYLTLEKYKAAIVSFDNFLEDFPGTKYKEQALYLKFKAAYQLGMKSIFQKKENRIKNAIAVYNKIKKTFPNSKYQEDLDTKKTTLNKELKELTKQTK